MPALNTLRRPLVTAATLIGLATLPATTLGHSDSLGAHVHGVANLQVAIEGSEIDLLFRSPADNLLGFEHAPRTDEQVAKVSQVESWLEQTPLVNTPAGDCRVTEAVVEHNLTQKKHDHDHHNDGDGHSHGKERSHSDIEVSQRLVCDSAVTDSLTSPLKGEYAAIEELIVDWVTDRQQGQVRLRSDNQRIPLTP